MSSSLNHVGFNLTKTKLQLVEVVNESMKYYLENVDEHVFEEEFDFNSDNSKIISILQESLQSLTERNNLKSKNISFTIPISECTLFEIPYESSLSNESLEDHIKWEYSILSPLQDVNEQIIRSQKLVSEGSYKRILIVGIPRLLVESIHGFASQQGLKLRFVNISHIASDTLINLSDKKVLSIYLDGSIFSLTSYVNKNLKTVKMFEKDSNLDILHSIELFVDNQNITYDNIIISGSSEVEELKVELESVLRLSAEIFNPFEGVPQSSSFIQNAYYMNRPNSFSAAAGVCFRKFK